MGLTPRQRFFQLYQGIQFWDSVKTGVPGENKHSANELKIFLTLGSVREGFEPRHLSLLLIFHKQKHSYTHYMNCEVMKII